MKIYNINGEKSNIKWSSQIGDKEIHGEMNANDGVLISELGKIIEGNVTVDLSSMKVTDTTLSKEEKNKIEKQLKSFPLLQGEGNLANYKIEKVIPRENEDQLKGVLTISNQAFGIDVFTNFQESENEIRANGKVQVEKSNPVLLKELDYLYENQIHDNKTIESFDLECELIATTE